MSRLHKSNVPTLLIQTCNTLFQSDLFADFSLGGGLALTLLRNHRRTNEIDLYTDKPFTSGDEVKIERFFQYSFGLTEHHRLSSRGNNKAFFVYNLNGDYVKVELHYSSLKFEERTEIEGWRFLSERDLSAVLLESLSVSGTKAEYWDLHNLLESNKAEELLGHFENAGTVNKKKVRNLICDFGRANEDFQPQCLKNKEWSLVKLDILDAFGE